MRQRNTVVCIWVSTQQLYVFGSLLKNSFLLACWCFSPLFLFLLLTGFSLQDSFEYINQDPHAGKPNTSQHSLGPGRAGSNLGKMRHTNRFSLWIPLLWVCLLYLSWLCCVVLVWFCIPLICVYFCVCVCFVCCPLCVCLQVCCKHAAANCCRGQLKEDLSGSPGVLLSLQVCVECWVQCDPHTLINPVLVLRKSPICAFLEIQGALVRRNIISNVAKFMMFWKFIPWTSIVNVSANIPADFDLKWALRVSKTILFLIFLGLFCCYELFPFAMVSSLHLFTCILICMEFL